MRFAIVGLKRSGSSYLVNLLGGHPDVHCCGEIFNPDGVNLRWPKEAGGRRAVRELESELEALRQTDPAAFLERVFTTDFGRPVVGFKIFKNHHPKALVHILADRNIAKIVHFRANVLARYASNLAARKSGNFGRVGDKPQVEFNEEEFVAYNNEHAAFFDEVLRKLSADGQRYYVSRYDEINNPACVAGLLKFLDVTAELPAVPDQPPNRGSSDILSRFTNFKEVKAFLRAHDLTHWAREGETLFAPI
jgi:hypothetical protein